MNKLALSNAPGNPEVRLHLALVLAKTRRNAGAKEELDTALKTGSEFESAGDARKLLQSFK